MRSWAKLMVYLRRMQEDIARSPAEAVFPAWHGQTPLGQGTSVGTPCSRKSKLRRLQGL